MPQDFAASTEMSTDQAVAFAPAPTPPSAGESSDRQLAQEITAALHAFQGAMDKAILAGLIVEPSFQAVGNRFGNVGISAESYLVKVKVFRRLS